MSCKKGFKIYLLIFVICVVNDSLANDFDDYGWQDWTDMQNYDFMPSEEGYNSEYDENKPDTISDYGLQDLFGTWNEMKTNMVKEMGEDHYSNQQEQIENSSENNLHHFSKETEFYVSRNQKVSTEQHEDDSTVDLSKNVKNSEETSSSNIFTFIQDESDETISQEVQKAFDEWLEKTQNVKQNSLEDNKNYDNNDVTTENDNSLDQEKMMNLMFGQIFNISWKLTQNEEQKNLFGDFNDEDNENYDVSKVIQDNENLQNRIDLIVEHIFNANKDLSSEDTEDVEQENVVDNNEVDVSNNKESENQFQTSEINKQESVAKSKLEEQLSFIQDFFASEEPKNEDHVPEKVLSLSDDEELMNQLYIMDSVLEQIKQQFEQENSVDLEKSNDDDSSTNDYSVVVGNKSDLKNIEKLFAIMRGGLIKNFVANKPDDSVKKNSDDVTENQNDIENEIPSATITSKSEELYSVTKEIPNEQDKKMQALEFSQLPKGFVDFLTKDNEYFELNKNQLLDDEKLNDLLVRLKTIKQNDELDNKVNWEDAIKHIPIKVIVNLPDDVRKNHYISLHEFINLGLILLFLFILIVSLVAYKSHYQMNASQLYNEKC